MKITIIGAGYVGLVTGACLADIGNHVLCLDTDSQKIEQLSKGKIPIYEPGLEEMVQRAMASGHLSFTTDVAASVVHGDMQFIAVGTPPGEDGSADLQYVLAAAQNIARLMQSSKIIINKSTVPVGTGDRVTDLVRNELQARHASYKFSVVSNPEFLKEGAALADFSKPDRIVIGTDESPAGLRAREQMHLLYAPYNRHHDRMIFMDRRSAELTKYAANAMLATRISFMNEVSRLAEKVGADIEQVRLGIGADPRIGYSFLYAGTGYGGSCFPKDVQALRRTGEEHGIHLKVLDAVEFVNERQKHVLVDKIVAHYGENLNGKVFAIWGLAFKPNTDDMRAAPSRVIVAELLKRGASVQVHDPVAMHEAVRAFTEDFQGDSASLSLIHYSKNQNEALLNADGLVLVTEWKSYQNPDTVEIKKLMRHAVVFDGRNQYDTLQMKQSGIVYYSIGRNG
jgi:UDPglucose 6-dehydrogenase